MVVYFLSLRCSIRKWAQWGDPVVVRYPWNNFVSIFIKHITNIFEKSATEITWGIFSRIVRVFLCMCVRHSGRSVVTRFFSSPSRFLPSPETPVLHCYLQAVNVYRRGIHISLEFEPPVGKEYKTASPLDHRCYCSTSCAAAIQYTGCTVYWLWTRFYHGNSGPHTGKMLTSWKQTSFGKVILYSREISGHIVSEIKQTWALYISFLRQKNVSCEWTPEVHSSRTAVTNQMRMNVIILPSGRDHTCGWDVVGKLSEYEIVNSVWTFYYSSRPFFVLQ